MGYDFDRVIDRRGTYSIKWDVGENELPMWVADMDFMTAPEITEAMRERLEHGVFGYTDVPERWYSAYTGWWKRRHGFEMEKEWLVFCTGVVPAISSTVRKLTTPGENVIIQTPVYNIFFNSIKNNGCNAVECPLRYENGEYSMDLEDLERKMSDPQTSLMLLCNPQNPTGRVWDAETLAKVGKLAVEHSVTVLSDEIHCDITEPGTEYVPFLSVSEECRRTGMACISPTKAFNIAGIQTAAVCIPDPVRRHRIKRALNTDEVAEPNVFAVTAAIAAFESGDGWLDELRRYISANRKLCEEYIKKEIPGVSLVRGEATYLLWIDVSRLGEDSSRTAAEIRRETGLFVSAGSVYGGGGGNFIRMNIACPASVCLDGLRRLKAGVEKCLSGEAGV